jgi:hypothetical protein
LAVLCAAAALPAVAGASDRLLWGNENVSSISFANLDGSGGGDLTNNTEFVTGLAIDSATGRLYYTNETGSINFLDLNGGPGGSLNTGSATVKNPDGLAIDPVLRKIFWANNVSPGQISFANLDGGGGGDLNTSGATMDDPAGVTVDTVSGRVYWANYLGSTISFANADNSGGGGDLQTPGVSPAGPAGVAIDEATRTIYWTETGGTDIGHARLDGSGGDDLPTPGAPVSAPYGLAIDSAAGKVYWANNSNSIEVASLAGSGGGPLSTSGASLDGPEFPILQKTPTGTGAPAISGGSKVGSTLTCSQGSWAPDLFGALLYRAPIAFSFQWVRDGRDISGAAAASFTASKGGEYKCRVTGSNPAGSAAQTSASHRVGPPVPPDFDTALLEGKVVYLRLKCAPRFKPECLGSAAAIASKRSCPARHRSSRCKPPEEMTASVSAKQKPNKWKVAFLKVKPKFLATVKRMAKKPNKKLLIVRQLVHSKRFQGGRPQSVFHVYRVRTATP